jgi:mono/diheme cytochrome c family protein
MEVLHDVRARHHSRGAVTARGAAECVAAGAGSRRARRVGAACVACAVALLGCGGERADRTADTAVAQGVPAAGAPPAPDSAAVNADATPPRAGDSAAGAVAAPAVILRADSAAGDSLYHGRGRCLTCHGAGAEGLARLGPSLRDSVWLDGDGSVAAIQRVILDGVAVPKQTPIQMPSFASQLTPRQAGQVAVYVYTLSHPGAAQADTATAARPPDTTKRPD